MFFWFFLLLLILCLLFNFRFLIQYFNLQKTFSSNIKPVPLKKLATPKNQLFLRLIEETHKSDLTIKVKGFKQYHK